jgi:hypothetical protein
LVIEKAMAQAMTFALRIGRKVLRGAHGNSKQITKYIFLLRRAAPEPRAAHLLLTMAPPNKVTPLACR